MVDEIVATSSASLKIKQMAVNTSDDGNKVDGILNRVGICCRTPLNGIAAIGDGSSFRHGFIVVIRLR